MAGAPAVLEEHRGTAARKATGVRRPLAEVEHEQAGKVAHAEMNGLDCCRSGATMPVYRLTPIDPNDPNWRTSIHRDVAVVRAGSEEEARSLASEAFDTTLAPSSPGGKIATPLWRHPQAVRAEVIQDRRYEAEGPAVILEPWGYL